MSTPLITVLVTTYNYGQFVEQAIDSVLAQEFPLERVQIVVVDDGSTDDTAGRVKKYGARVEYFYKPNGGQASALNFGFARTRGEIVALLDADDFCLPGKLARIAEAFEQNPALGMIYHRLREWHVETGEYTELAFLPVSGGIRNTPDLFLTYEPHPTSAVAFRRSSLEAFLPIPENIRMLADCFPIALMAFHAPILAIPEFLTMYRIHRKNSYYADARDMPVEMRKARLAMWRLVIPAMFKWLADNGYTRKQRPVRIFLDRWTIFLDNQEFLLKAPGRVRFFRHLLRNVRCYKSQMSARLRTICYINAFGSLALGYEHFHLLDKWRSSLASTMQRMSRGRVARLP
jgi:glycosyltransferase involved in cell wall biosynthesis